MRKHIQQILIKVGKAVGKFNRANRELEKELLEIESDIQQAEDAKNIEKIKQKINNID